MQKGEPFDIADEGWIADYYDAYDFINILLNGETIPETGGNNFSYFNDPTFNKRMDHANQLTGSQRDQTYGQLATDLAKGPAPWASRSFGTNIDFFGPKIGCQVNQGSYGSASEHLLPPLIARGWARGSTMSHSPGNPRGGASRPRPGSPEPHVIGRNEA